jgi:hypothetical protein
MLKAKHDKKIRMAAAAVILGCASSAGAQQGTPTCSDVLDIDVHGHHVVADYVTGIGHDTMTSWPPSGRQVGAAVKANRGAATPGGPGPGFHFPNGFAPGASFCTDSNSPGWHVGE